MDVSEGDYGFSLLNDCKYGHSADEHGIALTLLKGSTVPNPEADQETHRFTYSIMPHRGGWREANVPRMAYRLNVPVTAVRGMNSGVSPGCLPSFACVDKPNVILETVKKGLHGDATVLRLYECFGERAHVRVNLGITPQSACCATMLEDAQGEADLDGGALTADFRPYEIMTVMLR